MKSKRIFWGSDEAMRKWMAENDTGTISETAAKFKEAHGYEISAYQVRRYRRLAGTQRTKRGATKGCGSGNRRDVGAIRSTDKGYALIKAAENEAYDDPWRPLHVVAWENYEGRSLPDGYVVMAGDGNKYNVSPDNLHAVPIKLLGIMNGRFSGWANMEELKLAEALARAVSAIIDHDSAPRRCVFCGEEYKPIRRPSSKDSTVCPKCWAAGKRNNAYRKTPLGVRMCNVCGAEYTYYRKNSRKCPECVASPRGKQDWKMHKTHYERTGER